MPTTITRTALAEQRITCWGERDSTGRASDCNREVNAEDAEVVRTVLYHPPMLAFPRHCGFTILCPDCVEHSATECHHCRNLAITSQMHDVAEYESFSATQLWCDSCFLDHTWRCDRCRESFADDSPTCDVDGETWCGECNDNDTYYCDSCDENHADGADCPNSRSRNIHSYTYRPRPVFTVGPDETRVSDTPFFGVEIEIEAKRGTPKNLADIVAASDYASILYCKADGSLNDGVEIVSHPTTFAHWVSQTRGITTLLRALAAAGGRSYNTTTCGMHVHISRAAFTSLHLYKMMHFVYANRAFTTLISQRKPSYLESWAGLMSHCTVPEAISRLRAKAKANAEGRIGNGAASEGRYVAVNCENPNTVEVRIFRGSLKPSTVYKNLEYMQAAFLFTKSASMTDLSEAAFVTYVLENHDSYPNLCAFLALRPTDLAVENEGN